MVVTRKPLFPWLALVPEQLAPVDGLAPALLALVQDGRGGKQQQHYRHTRNDVRPVMIDYGQGKQHDYSQRSQVA